MASLIEAISVKRKSVFEFEGVPYACVDADVSTPTAHGGQTLVRLKMRNLVTQAVFEKTFKAGDKFKEPDLELVPATYLYRDTEGVYFLNGETYETLTLTEDMLAGAEDFLVDGLAVQLHIFNGNPIGLQLPAFVELSVTYTEPAERGDTSRGANKAAKLETGLEVRVPLFIKEGEKVRVSTETREFSGRA